MFVEPNSAIVWAAITLAEGGISVLILMIEPGHNIAFTTVWSEIATKSDRHQRLIYKAWPSCFFYPRLSGVFFLNAKIVHLWGSDHSSYFLSCLQPHPNMPISPPNNNSKMSDFESKFTSASFSCCSHLSQATGLLPVLQVSFKSLFALLFSTINFSCLQWSLKDVNRARSHFNLNI